MYLDYFCNRNFNYFENISIDQPNNQDSTLEVAAGIRLISNSFLNELGKVESIFRINAFDATVATGCRSRMYLHKVVSGEQKF